MLDVVCIPHGGGPMPLMNDPSHATLIEFLQRAESTIGRPKAIVLVSAHWECPQPTITSGVAPELIYDYGGFPAEMYQLSYPAPGAPDLADDVAALLADAGFDPQLDPNRGFDHGVFVPLLLMYPDASVPVIQLSMLSSLDPEAHIRMGEALRPLAERNVLVLGSGFTFHNMNAFGPGFSQDGTDPENEAFEQWLRETCASDAISEEERRSRYTNWSDAPGARWCHPREEHLLPLHVCYGAGGGPATQVFDDRVLGKRSSGYAWGGELTA
jgi:aromatic ring-opening dioxygenase catalytic subunit (LigB family)